MARIDHHRTQQIVLPQDLGAGGHSGAPTVTAVARCAFDWLDETLEG